MATCGPGNSLKQIILAGGHVRASAGDLVVHGALIACVCVCVCVCVRYQTHFSSRHESRLFLSTGKHPVVGQLPRVSFSSLLCLGRVATVQTYHTTKSFRFFISFRQYSESTLRSMQWTREAKNRSFKVQTVK